MSKIGDFNKSVKILKEMKKSMKENGLDFSNPAKMFGQMGLDIDGLEKTFNGEFKQKAEVRYVYKGNRTENIEPLYQYPTDSGFDLRSEEEVILRPMGRRVISTGMYFKLPERYEMQIRPRSGLAAKKGLTVLNSPGTVDCFSEDMKVLTIDGEKLISELIIGDIVFSINEDTLEIEKDMISEIFDTEEQDILVIETENGILEITPNTDVYTTTGLKKAKNLKNNDKILTFYD